MGRNQSRSIRQAIFVSLISMVLTGCVFPHDVTIRPVRITVIDAESKDPIEGMKVYYMLESHHIDDTLLFVIPSPDPQAKRTTRTLEEKFTDENGAVSFGPRSLTLEMRDKYFVEEIFINLELNADDLEIAKLSKLHKIEYLRSKSVSRSPDNYNRAYWGVNIYSTSYPVYQEEDGVVHTTFDVIWNSGGLNKTREDFIIELRKHSRKM